MKPLEKEPTPAVAPTVEVFAVVSTVILNAEETGELLFAASLATAVMLYVVPDAPPPFKLMSFVKLPDPSADVVPKLTPSLNNSTVELASALPLIVKLFVCFVTLSVLDEPESSAAAKSRVIGALGATISIFSVKIVPEGLPPSEYSPTLDLKLRTISCAEVPGAGVSRMV